MYFATQVYQETVVFGQMFPQTIMGANSSSRDDVASSFPSFVVENSSAMERGYVSFQGT